MNNALPTPYQSPTAEIAALAARYRRVNGPLMSLVNRFGGQIEAQMALLPDALRRQIEETVVRVLQGAHSVARAGRRAPDLGPRAAPVMSAVLGALGGMGGPATSLPELPVTVTLILHSIRRAAEAEGFDPDDPVIRAECLRVFAAGSPLGSDDGVNTAFLGARLTLSGTAVQSVIRAVAPRLAMALGQKLAAQAVPVIGAVAGAALNVSFLTYYREIASVRFALLRLAQTHGVEATMGAFQSAVQPPTLIRN